MSFGPWAIPDDPRILYADEREFVVEDEPDEPEYVCSNGHVFTKAMRRYADVFCPVCGTKDVGRNGEP